jgi:hypothetical protein
LEEEFLKTKILRGGRGYKGEYASDPSIHSEDSGSIGDYLDGIADNSFAIEDRAVERRR